ncbi:MAG: 30S ribosomal protein S3 [Firmicutes bacterium]|nr:30S ribosomal protein S3 [Bacillota bacterium]
MGQKVNPVGLRIGIIKDWESKWYAERKDFVDTLHEDFAVRKFISEQLPNSGISRVEIERAANRMRISVHTAKPGVVIGKGGSSIEKLRKQLDALTGKNTHINIIEIRVAELDAQLVAEGIAAQLEKRVAFRRAMKQAMGRTIRAGAKGIRVMTSGRLGGAEMSRTEWYTEGTVPLHTLRADIDYGFAEAKTTYGQIGVKVWIYKGEILPKAPKKQGAEEGGE